MLIQTYKRQYIKIKYKLNKQAISFIKEIINSYKRMQ